MAKLEVALTDYILDTAFPQLTAPAAEAAKAQLLDSLSVGFAGRHSEGVAEILALCEEWGGAPQSRVLVGPSRLPAPLAAQVNATMIHALDYDDGHGGALMHPGVIVTATLYAVADRLGGISGRDMVAATAVGTDLLCRLGLAIDVPTNRARTGWHFTSVFGCLVSAALTVRLMRLDSGAAANALGIAYHQASGNMQSVLDGSLTKRLGPGFAVRNGITAALLAARGASGTPNWLTGPNGLASLYFRGRFDEERLTRDLGVAYEGPRVGLKCHASCGITHPFIDAALALRAESEPSKIAKIRLFRGPGAEYVFLPEDARLHPRNIVDAQFSAPWGVALALARGSAGPEGYSDAAIADPFLHRFTSLMEVVVDEALTDPDGIEEGRVEITLQDGWTLSATRACSMNGDGQTLSMAAAAAKLQVCAGSVGDAEPGTVHRIVETFSALENMLNAADSISLFDALLPASG